MAMMCPAMPWHLARHIDMLSKNHNSWVFEMESAFYTVFLVWFNSPTMNSSCDVTYNVAISNFQGDFLIFLRSFIVCQHDLPPENGGA